MAEIVTLERAAVITEVAHVPPEYHPEMLAGTVAKQTFTFTKE